MSYSEEFIDFIATIKGEAGICGDISKRAVAHCIMNRIGFGEWVQHTSIMGYLKDDFDALTDETDAVRQVRLEMRSNKISKSTQHIIDLVSPIYNRQEEDFTNGIVLYWSPKAQAQLHKDKPKTYKYPPAFVNSETEKIEIKGTENDDMSWHRYKDTSRFYVQFVDKSARPLVNSRVSVGYKTTKVVPTLSNLLTNSQGKIRSILVKGGWGARFTVDGEPIVDNNKKPVLLIADGKNHSAVLVVANGTSGIKSQTDIHNQQSTPSQKQESVKVDDKASVEQKEKVNENDVQQKNVNFSIKVIDSENKAIPNFSYFLKYKNSEKKHSVGADGVENSLIALNGEEIIVLISGLDSKQEVGRFTVQDGMGIKTVKLNLHTFEILFRHGNTKKPITNLNLIQKYRNQLKLKKTNGNGKITVSAMPGFELNYKLRDERNLITIKVDKNKALRIIDVDSSAIEQASKNIKVGTKVPETQQPTPIPSEPKHKQPIQKPVESQDSTPKRDEKVKTSTEGHPKIAVNDNGEVVFTVLTYDKKTNKLESGISYILEYDGKKRSHVSGQDGVGIKKHKGAIGKQVNLYLSGSQKIEQSITITNNKQLITIKADKPELEYSGSQWCSRFMFSESLYDLAEPFGTNMREFVQCLRDAGISVRIDTTHRPDARGYLMYYSTMISRGKADSNNIPPWPGVNIDWTHGGDKAKARSAAQAMHAKYGVGNNAIARPGRSNHNPTKAFAVDMKITNIAGKTVKFKGKNKKVSSLSDLESIGKEFNVFWFGPGDKPHWSHDGH